MSQDPTEGLFHPSRTIRPGDKLRVVIEPNGDWRMTKKLPMFPAVPETPQTPPGPPDALAPYRPLPRAQGVSEAGIDRLAQDRAKYQAQNPLARWKFGTVTVFLNRACPRTCAFCGIADNSRRSMKQDQWYKAFENLQRVFGPMFYLFLGTEPLLQGPGLVDLIVWMKSRGMFYAFYSTSPEPLFTKWRDKLVDAGIDSWSSGIDTLPHLESMDPTTDKKVRESIIGLQWMASKGINTHITTTLHKKNLHLAPEIFRWCTDNIPGVEYAVNLVHWRTTEEFDFFAWPHEMQDMLWEGTEAERVRVHDTMRELVRIRDQEKRKLHTQDDYLLNAHLWYDTIDRHCQGHIGPSIEPDGSWRLCGYSTGGPCRGFNVLDLTPENFQEFWAVRERALAACPGCAWSCVTNKP